MKVLIWFVSFFCMAVIQMIIKDSGIILGGIPTALLFGLTWFVAQKLCKKWDRYQVEKKASEAGMTISEYGRLSLSEKIITALLSKRKLFLLLTVVSVTLMVTSVILFDYYGSSFFEHCANISLILTIIFSSISLINIFITVVIPYIRKGR